MRKIFACIFAALLALTMTATAADEPPDVDALVKQLKDEDAVVRLKAAKALGKLGKKAKDAVPRSPPCSRTRTPTSAPSPRTLSRPSRTATPRATPRSTISSRT